MMELHELGLLAADLIERIGNAYPDARVSHAFFMVEVDDGDHLAYFKATNDERHWVQAAFVDQAADALFSTGVPIDDDE